MKQIRVGDTIVLRCDCGKMMERRERGVQRWECPRCKKSIPLSHLTPLAPEVNEALVTEVSS